MLIFQQFIDAGWWTHPVFGKLERKPDGKKTVPKPPAGWRETYTETRNTKAYKLGGAFTGAPSGIIALDCDNAATYEFFKRQDPDYKFHFISKGKPEGGGTIIYKYDSDVPQFSLTDDYFKLEFFTDNGAVYLPTDSNHTKEPWPFLEIPPLKAMPELVKALLTSLSKKNKSDEPRVACDVEGMPRNIPVSTGRLAPLLDVLVATKEYEYTLFKIITPKAFRELDQYVRQGHIHPKDIPKGRGSEYLSKVSAILGSDISVSKELYQDSMKCIYQLRGREWPAGRLFAEIINPMIEEKSSINGQVIWQYDKDWSKLGFIATAINRDYIESFFDDVRGLYYLINYTAPYLKWFTDKNPCISMLKALLGRKISETQYDTTKQLVRTDLDPSQAFGHVAGTDRFNLFRQTPELDVLNFPDNYASQYNRPTTILQYFESLIPDKEMHDYVLSFVRTKLTTFKYSPVVLYFIGVPGSGKDTFISILGRILGTDYIAKPETKLFLDQFNGYLLDKFFVHLDEYGNKLKGWEKDVALGKIKSISGSPDIQIRAMRQEATNYLHRITVCMTDNKQAMNLEIDDRRIAYIKTPNRLDRQDWVIEAGGISEVQDRIKAEIQDFCYYISTEVENLNGDRYVIAPETLDKESLIVSGMPANQMLGYYAGKGNFAKLEDLGIEYNVFDFTEGWGSGRLSHDKLFDLYNEITEGKGNPKALARGMKDAGIKKRHTTMCGENMYYYEIDGLHKYATMALAFKSGNAEE